MGVTDVAVDVALVFCVPTKPWLHFPMELSGDDYGIEQTFLWYRLSPFVSMS